MKYLGHIMSFPGVSTNTGKVAAIRYRPVPMGLKELLTFLGSIGYYQQYLKDFTTDVRPLNRLTVEGTGWNWDEAAQHVFIKEIEGLATAPVQGYPDPKKYTC